ncbi:MAG: IS607 family transposase [Hadesarchaea archaeon]|nr:MAG: IS607 family transposase [Hadesarchaea archaeon]
METREEKLYSTGKAAKLLGISFITIKRWIYAGRIKAIRTPTKRYLIPESEIRRLLGQQAPKNRAVIYARVSSADQRGELKRQREMLRKYAEEKGYRVVGTFQDIASGLNGSRRGLKKVFEALRAGQADVIVVAWKDRLTRFGFRYLENHAGDLGARIEVANEGKEETPQRELVEDLLAIVTSFAGRLYGMRSNGEKKVVEAVRRAIR